jgi:hypothetical protein
MGAVVGARSAGWSDIVAFDLACTALLAGCLASGDTRGLDDANAATLGLMLEVGRRDGAGFVRQATRGTVIEGGISYGGHIGHNGMRNMLIINDGAHS